jgi:hypothetical protein
MQFGQTYCKYILTRILRKFISYLSKFYFIFYEFWNLERISGNSKWKKWKKKNGAQYWAAIRPMALHRWLSPEGKMANQPVPLVRHGVTWRGHRVLPPHGGAAVAGASVAKIGLGLHQKGGGEGVASGMVKMEEAH